MLKGCVVGTKKRVLTLRKVRLAALPGGQGVGGAWASSGGESIVDTGPHFVEGSSKKWGTGLGLPLNMSFEVLGGGISVWPGPAVCFCFHVFPTLLWRPGGDPWVRPARVEVVWEGVSLGSGGAVIETGDPLPSQMRGL